MLFYTNHKTQETLATSQEVVLVLMRLYIWSIHLDFFITDERFKRAGLDYWDHLNLKQYADFDDFIKQNQIDDNLFLFTKKANNYLSNIDFKEYLDHDQRIYLVFGQETNGLPEQLLNKYQNNLVKIPMHNAIRSFNLANSVICALYELSRQNQFKNVK